MVGQGGLEPPTSRLSGVRSNHLSYWPLRALYLTRTQVNVNNLSRERVLCLGCRSHATDIINYSHLGVLVRLLRGIA